VHAPEQTEVSARECLDYLVIFNERHLRRVFTSYLDYYHRRTHHSLDKDCPEQQPIQVPKVGAHAVIPNRRSKSRTKAAPRGAICSWTDLERLAIRSQEPSREGLSASKFTGPASAYLKRYGISGSKSPIVLLFGKMTPKSACSFEFKHRGLGVRSHPAIIDCERHSDPRAALSRR